MHFRCFLAIYSYEKGDYHCLFYLQNNIQPNKHSKHTLKETQCKLESCKMADAALTLPARFSWLSPFSVQYRLPGTCLHLLHLLLVQHSCGPLVTLSWLPPQPVSRTCKTNFCSTEQYRKIPSYNTITSSSKTILLIRIASSRKFIS